MTGYHVSFQYLLSNRRVNVLPQPLVCYKHHVCTLAQATAYHQQSCIDGSAFYVTV